MRRRVRSEVRRGDGDAEAHRGNLAAAQKPLFLPDGNILGLLSLPGKLRGPDADLADGLPGQLAEVQRTLAQGHAEVMALLQSRLEAAHCLEVQAAALRTENEELRARLVACSSPKASEQVHRMRNLDGFAEEAESQRQPLTGAASPSGEACADAGSPIPPRPVADIYAPEDEADADDVVVEVPPRGRFNSSEDEEATVPLGLQILTKPALHKEATHGQLTTASPECTRVSLSNLSEGTLMVNKNSSDPIAHFKASFFGGSLGQTTGSGTDHPAVRPVKPRWRNSFLPDAEKMKEQVRNAISQKEYCVFDFYHEEGVWQTIAKSAYFEHITMAMICVNAIWIAVDTDYNQATLLTDSDPIFVLAEHFFCVYFSLEWSIRFMAFRNKLNCFRDRWFVFDACLVALMVVETWALTIVFYIQGTHTRSKLVGSTSVVKLVRLLRLTRIARMAKVLVAMPELMVLVKGLGTALRSVFFTMVLLTFFIYVFGIAFTQVCKGTELEGTYFPSVAGSMAFLLVSTTTPDLYDVVMELGMEQLMFGMLFYAYLGLTYITVMNLLIGVLVEVVSVTSAVETERLRMSMLKEHLWAVVANLDEDQDGTISLEEFQTLLSKPEAAKALQAAGVDAVGLIDFQDFLFQDRDAKVTFPEFFEFVLELRGGNKATVKDLVDLRKFLHMTVDSMEKRLNRQMSAILGAMPAPAKLRRMGKDNRVYEFD